MKIKHQILGLLTAFTVIIGNASAAKLIQPPIQDLFKERNQITVLELKSVNKEEDRAEFSKVKDLWGETEATIKIKLSKNWVEKLKPGQRYIVGHSKFRKHPLLRDEIQPNPDGPSVLHPYVVDDAIFDDSEALQELITAFQHEKKDPAKLLAKNLEILASSQGNTRLLAAFQFQMSGDLYPEGLHSEHLELLQKALSKEDLSAEESEFIVRASQAFPDGKRPAWIVEYCRNTVDKNAVPYDLQSFIPLLVKTCATTLGKDGDKTDITRLSHLLLGNSPGVSKSALRALEAQAGDETPQLIADVLKNNPRVHNETQGVLSTYLYEYSQRKNAGKGY